MFLFDTLAYFCTTPFTFLYFMSHQEFHEFPELRVSQYFLRETRHRIVQNTRISRNLRPMKLPRNLCIADTWL